MPKNGNMTLQEKLEEVKKSFTPDMDPKQRNDLMLDLLTLDSLAGNSDLLERSVDSLKADNYYWIHMRRFSQYGILDKMLGEMDSKQLSEVIENPSAFGKKVETAQEKFRSDTIDANTKKFDDTHPEDMYLSAFTEKAKENGWLFPGDENMISSLYYTARQSGFDKYIELYDKMLTTDVKTPQARKAFIDELKAAASLTENDPLNLFVRRELETAELKDLVADVTQEEIDQRYKKFQKKQAVKKEKAELKEIFKANGWKQPDEAADAVYSLCKEVVDVKDQSKLDEVYEKLKTAKIDKKKPYTSQNALIKEATKVYDAQAGEKPSIQAATAYRTLNKKIYDKFYEGREKEAEIKAEKKSLAEKLKENGWNISTANSISGVIYDMCKTSKAKNKEPIDAMYDKLLNTKINKDMPLNHMKELCTELSDTFSKNTDSKKNKSLHDLNEKISLYFKEDKLRKEKEAYYSFDKNIKASESKSKEADTGRKAPTFDSLIKADDNTREVHRKWEEQQKAFEQEQTALENRKISRDIQTTTSETFTLFDQTKRLFHSDTAEFTNMKNSIAALNFATAMANKNNTPIMQDEKFRNALLAAYKASNAYRVKKLQDENKPLDSNWHPTSKMGEARWNGALAIEELAKKYIPEMVNQYHNEAEKNAYEQGYVHNKSVTDKVNAEYNKALSDLDKKAESVRRMSFAEDAGSAQGRDKEQIENQLAKLLAIKTVGRLYQANAEAGVKEKINDDTFLAEVTFTAGDIKHREDFQHMIQNNSAEDLITAAKQNGGQGLMVKLSEARKELIKNLPAEEAPQPEVKKELNKNAPNKS